MTYKTIDTSSPPDFIQIPVAVLILNWNSLEWTRKCLEGLRALDYPRYSLIVIDNGSEDGSPDVIAREFPRVTLLRAKENLGVGGGRNLGIEHVLKNQPEIRYLLFLDNDARPAADALKQLVSAAEANPKLAVASGKIYYMDRPTTLWSCGGKVLLHRADVKLRGMGLPDDGAFDRPEIVDMVAGAAFFVRKSVIEAIGSFDPDFILYFCEDTEWCLRAAKRGYDVCYVPDAVFWHQVSKSAPGRRYWFLKGRNNFLLLKKHGKLHHWLLFPFFMTWALVRATVRELLKGNVGAIGTLLKGGVEGLLGRNRKQ